MHSITSLVVWLSLVAHAQGQRDWVWRTGRATHYGGPGDPWSIHQGSCQYKYLDPTVNKGWDVAALPDVVHDYKGSCGRCYEIGCMPMHLKDGYGTGLDRNDVCFDSSKTVVVMITDSCPCVYPPNQYSNKRWCCGDYYHFDMSTWAFEKLAERKWGVIGIRYREVPCDHCPDNPATLPHGACPAPPSEGAPGSWTPSADKRPGGKMCFKSSLDRSDGSVSSTSSYSNSGGNSGGQQWRSQWFPSWFPSDSLLSSWQDFTAKMDPWSATAPDGQPAYCGTLEGHSSLSFRGSPGSLMRKTKLVIDVKTNNGNAPDFALSLGSASKGKCRTIHLKSIQGSTRNGDWLQINIPLVNVAWWTSLWSSDDRQMFTGCSSSIGAWDINQIDFTNNWGGRQALCLANVKAY